MNGSGTSPLLEVSGLSVDYALKGGRLWSPRGRMFRAVSDVSLNVHKGETVAIVGESGSGKSTVARTIMGLINPAAGSIRLNGTDIVRRSGTALRHQRRKIQMVFQDPYSSLNPSLTVEEIVAEPLKVHMPMTRSTRLTRIVEVLGKVGLGIEHANRYPYEFSGGQRQRIAIARAIVLDPDIVVLDEPVSALDVPTQNQIIKLLESLRTDLGTAFLVIAHDLSLVRHIAHRVAVMYLGRVVESGDTHSIFEAPAHPYTQALLNSAPVPDPDVQRMRNARVRLAGELPDPANPPRGCVFNTRCPSVMPICRETAPAQRSVGRTQLAACHLLNGDVQSAAAKVNARMN